MSQSKPLHELTDEELLKSLEDTTLYQDKDAFDISLMTFIAEYNILPGKDLVSNSVLHKLFCLWSKSKLTIDTFEAKVKKMLPVSTKTKKLMYLVNRNLLDLNKEIEKQLIKSKARTKVSRSSITQMHNFVRFYEFKSGPYEWPDYAIHALLRKYAIQRKTKFTDAISMFKWFKLNRFDTKVQQEKFFICLNKKPEEIFTTQELQQYEQIWKKGYKKVRTKGKIEISISRSEAESAE